MKKLLRSALAILVVGAIAATFSACGPEPADVPVDNTPAAGEPVISTAPDAPLPVDSTTIAPVTEDPALSATVDTQPTEVITTPEETTVSTPAETEKATEKTEKKTEKTEKPTEKTEKKTEKTEKVTEATKDTEPEEGSRLPDDGDDEDVELDWEDIDIDEWLDMMGAEGGGEDIPDIGVNE